MAKNILVISASPRKGGNSDTLCDEFIRGATESGNKVEKVRLAEKNINYCTACGGCAKKHVCTQNDDMTELLQKFAEADAVVLATPVYFYCINAQLKTFFDRCLPRYTELSNKQFYIFMTAADNAKDTFDESLAAINGFLRCLNGAEIVKTVRGIGVYRPWEVKNTRAMEMAYLAGVDA